MIYITLSDYIGKEGATANLCLKDIWSTWLLLDLNNAVFILNGSQTHLSVEINIPAQVVTST